MKQNDSPGERSEARRRRWKPGQEQHPGPENQESQHKLNQPSGSFPDKCVAIRNHSKTFRELLTKQRGRNRCELKMGMANSIRANRIKPARCDPRFGGLRLQSLWPPTEVPNARHCKQPKNSRKRSQVGHGETAEKQPEKQPKHRKTVKTLVFQLFRLFSGCLAATVTHSAPFSAVLRLFSMSGIWHLCRWPQRLQH